MTDFQQAALELAAEQQTPAWLAALRQQGASTWAAAAWPGRKTEHWKYISLAPLQQCEQLGWSSESDDVALDAVEQIELDATTPRAPVPCQPASCVSPMPIPNSRH